MRSAVYWVCTIGLLAWTAHILVSCLGGIGPMTSDAAVAGGFIGSTLAWLIVGVPLALVALVVKPR
jgi:hypothetical protein